MRLPLLQTKLYIPSPRQQLVTRPAVTAKLRAGLLQPLTLIAAPAGFGKTTLVSEWVAQTTKAVAWLSLDDEDNEPTRFLTYLLAALQTQQPTIGAAAQGLLTAPETPPKAILTLLLNDLSELASPMVLVLDDYHLITTPAIHDALAFLIDHLPAAFRLIIISRIDPPFPLARWRVRNQLTELRASDLYFRLEEAAVFLNDVMGLTLTKAEIDTLETRTEGWVAGLQLAALSLQGRQDVAGFIRAFSGSHRHVLSYLVEEVLNRRPEGTLDFLLQTSLLERLSAPLCAALTGRGDSQALLTRLEQANFFLIPLDDEGKWYRYHHLFAEVLRTRLYETQADQILPLQQRASTWYEQQELWSEAIHHALAVDDFARVARLIEQIGLTLFAQPTIQHALNRWLSTLPATIIRARPRLCLIYAWILDAHRDSKAALQWVAEAEAAYQANPTAFADAPIQGEIAAIRARLLVGNPNFMPDEALPWGQQALATLSAEQATFRSIAALAVSHAYVKLGQMSEAEQFLDEAKQMGRAARNVFLYVSAAANQAVALRALGSARRAQTLCQDALTWVTQHNALAYPIVGGLYLNLADLLREQNDLVTAQQYAEIAVARTDQEVNPASMFILSRLVLLRVKQAQGDWPSVWRLLQEVSQQVSKHPTIIPATLLAAITAQFQLAQSLAAQHDHTLLTEAVAWAQAIPWQEGVLLEANRMLSFIYLYEHQRLARAQIFIAWARSQGNQSLLRETLAYLERQQQIAEASNLLWFQIKIHLLQALAYQALDATELACAALIRALQLAQPEGYLRIFLDEGEPMRLLITDYRLQIANPQQRAYAEQLLSAYSTLPITREPSLIDQSVQPLRTPHSALRTLVEPLSEREVEVLHLIAAGLSNQEIAERLIISISTVKTHINRIFSKLDVQSRTQALVRARELGLLGE